MTKALSCINTQQFAAKTISKDQQTLIKLLKTSIVIGFCLILLGIYFHNYSEKIDSLGVTGIIISATCIALGLVFSLPTKMYLTFLLIKRETDLNTTKPVDDNKERSSPSHSDINSDINYKE